MSRFSCIALFLAFAITAPAQTFTTLISFTTAEGIVPRNVTLAQGTDGNLYGTTSADGAHGYGAFFGTTTSGTLTLDYSFDLKHGATPWSGAILAADGNFYGTTLDGGVHNGSAHRGTVYRMTPAGVITTLRTFDETDGSSPYAPLVQDAAGDFYGTTGYGGADSSGTILHYGTVFKITPGGTLTTLHAFVDTDGSEPFGGLVQGADGDFYGTTYVGGPNTCPIYHGGCGTIFKITAKGAFTNLHNFDGTDGCGPQAAMVQGSDGYFYGTTSVCGANGQGTLFEMDSTGSVTTLHSFCAPTVCADGATPYGTLIEATDGKLYGTTSFGGTAGFGTIFSLTPAGNLTTIFTFGYFDGNWPLGGLIQATDGNIYGTTESSGTVYRLSTGLAPFVKTVPAAARPGSAIIILGNSLTGASAVTFNGEPSEFTVVSDTEITATVPSSATSGTVQVITPGGTLTSYPRFRVFP